MEGDGHQRDTAVVRLVPVLTTNSSSNIIIASSVVSVGVTVVVGVGVGGQTKEEHRRSGFAAAETEQRHRAGNRGNPAPPGPAFPRHQRRPQDTEWHRRTPPDTAGHRGGHGPAASAVRRAELAAVQQPSIRPERRASTGRRLASGRPHGNSTPPPPPAGREPARGAQRTGERNGEDAAGQLQGDDGANGERLTSVELTALRLIFAFLYAV